MLCVYVVCVCVYVVCVVCVCSVWCGTCAVEHRKGNNEFILTQVLLLDELIQFVLCKFIKVTISTCVYICQGMIP